MSAGKPANLFRMFLAHKNMKLIPLGKGLSAKVDDADYDWLNRWKWHAIKSNDGKTWYARRAEYLGEKDGKRKNRIFSMHRQILGLTDRRIEGDHRNGDGLDNQRNNLRVALPTQNKWNRHRRSIFSSKYKGVTWNKWNEAWLARITVNGNRIQLGYFNDETEAGKAYNEASVRLHKDFSCTNEIGG